METGGGATTIVATRLRRSTRDHDAYTVRVASRRVAALATAHAGDARRWIYTTRWLHRSILRSAGTTGSSRPLVVGLGVQWTPRWDHQHQQYPPPPATIQLCVGHRCLVFHLARADSVPAALYRFLADPRVLFVGSGNAYDRRMLWEHYGMDVAAGCELRAVAGMGNASMERMAERFLGYNGITKPKWVAMGAWHAPRLSAEQVEYACVDAYLAFRLGLILCCGGDQYLPVPPQQHRAPLPPTPRAPVFAPPPPAPQAPVLRPAPPPPAPRVEVSPRALHTIPAPPAPVWIHCPLLPGPRGSLVIPASTGSDMDSEHCSETGSNDLPVIRSSYGTDEEGDDGDGFFSSDEFELVRYASSPTDDEDDQEDGIGIDQYLARTGLLSDDDDYVVAPDGYEEEGYTEYTGIGILTADADHHIKEYTGILAVGNGAPPEDDGEAGYYYW